MIDGHSHPSSSKESSVVLLHHALIARSFPFPCQSLSALFWQSRGVIPDDITYNAMISVCVRCGKEEAARFLFEERKSNMEKDALNALTSVSETDAEGAHNKDFTQFSQVLTLP